MAGRAGVGIERAADGLPMVQQAGGPQRQREGWNEAEAGGGTLYFILCYSRVSPNKSWVGWKLRAKDKGEGGALFLLHACVLLSLQKIGGCERAHYTALARRE